MPGISNKLLASLMAVRSLKEELQLLQEPGSYVGEVVKVMGKSKVLVKVSCLVLHHFLSFSVGVYNIITSFSIILPPSASVLCIN